MEWISIIFDPQVQQIGMMIIAAFIAWRERRNIVKAAGWAAGKVTGAGGTADNREELSGALVLISDHVATIKCDKLRGKADAALVTLAEACIRNPGFDPEPEAK